MPPRQFVKFGYRPLDRYLATLPPAQDTVRLTLGELVALLGPATSSLPTSMPNWNATNVAQRFALRRDFAAHYDRSDAGAIVFTRREHTTSDEEPT